MYNFITQNFTINCFDENNDKYTIAQFGNKALQSKPTD